MWLSQTTQLLLLVAATPSGLTATQDYVEPWTSEPSPLGEGDVQAQLDQRCAELEAAYPRARLEALVAGGGSDPDSGIADSDESTA